MILHITHVSIRSNRGIDSGSLRRVGGCIHYLLGIDKGGGSAGRGPRMRGGIIEGVGGEYPEKLFISEEG